MAVNPAPLGRAVIGGLAMATLATLIVLPCVFALVQARASAKSASLDPDDPASIYFDTVCARQSGLGGHAMSIVQTRLPSLAGAMKRKIHPRFRCRDAWCQWVATLLMVASAGCHGSSSDNAPGRDAGETAVRVAAIQPQRKTLERRVEQPGEIAAQEATPLYARVPGYVQSVLVDIGDKIKKGQTLAVLSVPELEQELNQKQSLHVQALSQVAQADAAVEVAKAAIDTAESKIAMAEAAVKKTQADVDRWKSEYDRVYKLTESSAINQKVADETLNQLRAAESNRAEAEAQVKSLQAMLRESQARHKAALANAKAAGARVDVATADTGRTQSMLDYAEILCSLRWRRHPCATFIPASTSSRLQPGETSRCLSWRTATPCAWWSTCRKRTPT